MSIPQDLIFNYTAEDAKCDIEEANLREYYDILSDVLHKIKAKAQLGGNQLEHILETKRIDRIINELEKRGFAVSSASTNKNSTRTVLHIKWVKEEEETSSEC